MKTQKIFAPYFSYIFFIATLLLFVTRTNAQSQNSSNEKTVRVLTQSGEYITLATGDDVDGDGVPNGMEVNGYFWDSDSFKMRLWNGDTTIQYYITDPLQASTDQDPYNDYTEVSKVGLDVTVMPPEDHPLVAARPRIYISMSEYNVFPLSIISSSNGGSQGTSYTNETSSSYTYTQELSTGIELGTGGLNSNVQYTESNSWTNSYTNSTTSSSEINWENSRTTEPDQAARLEFIIQVANNGSAEALNIVPTVNLKLGDKIISTFDLTLIDALNPGQSSNDFNVSTANGNDITLTINELRALHLGAPLTFEVFQVTADVETVDANNNTIVKPWNIYTGDIDVVSVDILANIGSNELERYQLFAGWTNWDPQYSFKTILSRIFDLENINGVTQIESRDYPSKWLVNSPSAEVLNEWTNAGQPNNILDLRMHPGTQITMLSPEDDSKPTVELASYSNLPGDTSSYSRVLVSASAINLPITEVIVENTINGEVLVDTLIRNENGFYFNENAIVGVPDGPGTVYVKNARGEISTRTISIPAIYSSAAEVKEFSSFLPNPGGNYWLYYKGDPAKPMPIYCLFFDADSGYSLDTPMEYVQLKNNGELKNYSDWIYDTDRLRVHFDKIRINLNTLKVDSQDTTFVSKEVIDGNSIFLNCGECIDNTNLFGKVKLQYGHLDTAYAKFDLTGTPFHFNSKAHFATPIRGAHSDIQIDPEFKKVEIVASADPNGAFDAVGFVGFDGDSIQLSFTEDFVAPPNDNTLDGNALVFNENSSNGFVTMGDSDSLRVQDTFTIEMWIYPTGDGTDSTFGGTIINKEGEYEIARFPDGSIQYAIANEDNQFVWVNSNYIAEKNVWTHITLVQKYSGIFPEVNEIYIHSEKGLEFAGKFGNYDFGDRHPDNNIFMIGSRELLPNINFEGMIDEVRLWNMPRTTSEIFNKLIEPLSSEYYSTLDSGLIGYWRFDALEDLGVGEPGTNDVRDLSANANHGDVRGDVVLSSGLPTDIKNDEIIPIKFALHQNYPNPFNPATTIKYQLPEKANVLLTIHNILGQEVKTLVNEEQNSGTKTLEWNGNNNYGSKVSSGIYFYRIVSNNFIETKKMILLK